MSSKKRRSYSAEFKFQVVLEVLRGERSAAQICRDHNLRENLLSRWKQEFLERGASVFETTTQQQNELEAEWERAAELERLVGRLILEKEILKKAGRLLGSDWSENGQ
jgi:transposase